MRFLIVGAILAGFTVLPGVAQGASDSDIESKIIALELVAKEQACRAKDIKTLDALMDDAFMYVDPEGHVQTKTEVLLSVQNVTVFSTYPAA